MAKRKKTVRSSRHGTDELDIYISWQAKPRFVMYATGEKMNLPGMFLDDVRNYVQKNKSALQPLYTIEDGYYRPIKIKASNEEQTEIPKLQPGAAKVFRRQRAASSNTDTVTVVVNGIEIVCKPGSRIEAY